MWLRLWWVRSVMTVDPWTLHYQLTLPELWCHGNRSVQTAPYLSVLFCLRDTLLLMFKLDISFRGRKFVSHPTGFISGHMINDLKVVILIQARRSITSKPSGFLSSESWQLNGSMAAAERPQRGVCALKACLLTTNSTQSSKPRFKCYNPVSCLSVWQTLWLIDLLHRSSTQEQFQACWNATRSNDVRARMMEVHHRHGDKEK